MVRLTQIGVDGDAVMSFLGSTRGGDWQDVERASDGDADVVMASRLTENERLR